MIEWAEINLLYFVLGLILQNFEFEEFCVDGTLQRIRSYTELG